MDLATWNLGLLPTVASAVLGYLLGSIPFGLLLTQMAGLGDVRSIGSGNIGATNVLRTGNKKLAAATLLLDALKATFAVVIASVYWGVEGGIVAGLAAFLGHLFPVWLGFKGGKGVATYLGVLLGLSPTLLLVFAVVWLVTAKVSRYSSLSALTATVAAPIAAFFVTDIKVAFLLIVMTLITWWKHKANIQRLLKGTEGRIGDKG